MMMTKGKNDTLHVSLSNLGCGIVMSAVTRISSVHMNRGFEGLNTKALTFLDYGSDYCWLIFPVNRSVLSRRFFQHTSCR